MSFDDVYLPLTTNGARATALAAGRPAHYPLGARVAAEGRARRGRALTAALLGIAGPLAVLALLPEPRGQFRLLMDDDPTTVIGALAVLLATSVAALLLAWAAVIVLAALAGRAPGATGRAARALSRRITPTLLRQFVVATAGLSIATGLAACSTPPAAAPAAVTSFDGSAVTTARYTATYSQALPASLASRPAALTSPAAALRPGTTTGSQPGPTTVTVDLDWPTESATIDDGFELTFDLDWPAAAEPTTPADDAAPTPAPTTTERSTVTVRAGDSLWSIAAAQLPPDANHAQIDAAWRAWYAANLDLIGPDPGLILPGQQLVAPSSAPQFHVTHSHPGGLL